MSAKDKTGVFTILIEGEFALDDGQVWPDGDGPDNPTVDDVVACIKETTGSLEDLIEFWNLKPTVTVRGPVVRESGSEAVNW